MTGRGYHGRSLLHDMDKRALRKGWEQDANRRRLGSSRRTYADWMKWGAQDASRYYDLRWPQIDTLYQAHTHNYSSWWLSRGRCQGHHMTFAKTNTRRQGMDGFCRNTNKTKLPGQIRRRLKGNNSRGLIFGVRGARCRSKKGGKGQRRRTSDSKPAFQIWKIGLDPLKVAKDKITYGRDTLK